MAIVMSEINDVRIGFFGFDSMFGSIIDLIDETHLFHTCSLLAQDGSIIIIEAYGSCSRFFFINCATVSTVCLSSRIGISCGFGLGLVDEGYARESNLAILPFCQQGICPQFESVFSESVASCVG